MFLGNIGGIGQGGGSSPIEWLAVLLVIINTFKQFLQGAIVTDPTGKYTFKLHVLSYVDDNSILRTFQPEEGEEAFSKISQEMIHWLKILQLTGGDLALQKCHLTLMKWKWGPTSGRSSMVKTSEFPGTATIDTTSLTGEAITQHIKRYGVNEGERQLGIRMPIDGSFKQEFQYRMEQSKKLGWKLYCSPLNTTSSFLMYKVYCSTTLRYPLSITKFTQVQSNKIQQKFYKCALPKMGLNRHTPNAVRFGPYRYGGCQFMDIYTEQLYQHLKELLKHIRQGDSVGSAFMANLNAINLLIGSSTHFLQINPAQIQYVNKDNTPCYLWQATWEHDIKIHFPTALCIHQQQRGEENTIMDIALQIPKYKNNKRLLCNINACRIYHGVIWISDMATYDGKYINASFLNGYRQMRHRSNQQYTWPTQPNPTKAQWSTWKEFIHGNFLAGLKLATAIIPNPIQFTSWKTQAEQALNKLTTEHSIDDIIYNLPMEMQIFVQYISLPTDEDYQLWQYLNTSQLIGATDGTHIPATLVACGAFILAYNDDINLNIKGGSKCRLTHKMSSQTSEHYGAIRIIVMTIILSVKFGIPAGTHVIDIWMDNAEVLRRSTITRTDALKLSEYDVKDYSLWCLMNKMVTLTVMKIEM